MEVLAVNTGLLALILVMMNFLAIILIKTGERFWLPSLGLWILFILFFIVFHVLNKDLLLQKQIAFEQASPLNAVEKSDAWFELEQTKNLVFIQRRKLARLLGIQTIAVFFCQALGLLKTGKKEYRAGLLTFLILSLLYGILELLYFI